MQTLGNGYRDSLLGGIGQEPAAHEYDLLLYSTHRRKTRQPAYVAQVACGRANGLLLVVPRDPGAYIDSLRRRRPTITSDQDVQNILR